MLSIGSIPEDNWILQGILTAVSFPDVYELIVSSMENNVSKLELICDHDNCHYVYSWSIIPPDIFSNEHFVCGNDTLVSI
ncbi:hypothetical protein TNCV_4283481 [Trichonephila clavipes]|nr:hypothetical protein TNCV_4283481 [Trichonephila clavipes]